MFKWVLGILLLAPMDSLAINAIQVAAWTTVGVNLNTIAQSVRHPKVTTKAIGTKVKKVIKGTH